MISRKVIVSGKVQGVYYRASAKQKAMMLGLSGYVRNESDGSVSLGLEGDAEAVEAMTNWCKKGPALAKVKQFRMEDSPRLQLESFEVFH